MDTLSLRYMQFYVKEKEKKNNYRVWYKKSLQKLHDYGF